MSQQRATVLPPHNGWPNYPTWAVLLWINNTQHLRAECEGICIDANGERAIVADNLRDWVITHVGEASEGMASDLAKWAAEHCDWRRMAADLCDEVIEAAASAGVDQQLAVWDRDGLYREA